MLKQVDSSILPNNDDSLLDNLNETANSWNLKDSLYDINPLKKSPWASYPIWSNDFANESINKNWSLTPTNANNSPNNTITSLHDEWKNEFSDCDAFKSNESNSDFKLNDSINNDPIHDQVVDEKTIVLNKINSPNNWGQFPIDQTTPWDLNGSIFDENKNASDSNVWESEPPSGTAIWDKHYANVALTSSPRKRENSVETLAPKPSWNGNNSSISCESNQGNNQQSINITANSNSNNSSNLGMNKDGAIGNCWNKQINGLSNNFSTLLNKKPTFNNHSQNQNLSNSNCFPKPLIQNLSNQVSCKNGVTSNNNNNTNNGLPSLTGNSNKPSRPLSLNSMCPQQGHHGENSTCLSMNGHSATLSTSVTTNPITSQPLQIHNNNNNNSNNNGSASSYVQFNQNALKNHRNTNANKISPVLSNLPMPLNTFLSAPPPIQNYNPNFHPPVNPPSNGLQMNSNSLNGGSFRADLTKKFINLGYNKDDVQSALINNNMDVERTIGELDGLYPHLTYKAIDHFAILLNQMHIPKSYTNNVQDWKLQRHLKKLYNDKDSSISVNESNFLTTSKMIPSQLSHPKYNAAMNMFPFKSPNAFPQKLSSSNSSEWGKNQGSSPFLTNNKPSSGNKLHHMNHQTLMNGNQQNFNYYIQDNFWSNGGGSSSSNSDFMTPQMKIYDEYDTTVSSLMGIAKRYEVLQEKLQFYLSNPKASDSPTNSTLVARELQAKLVQLETQFVALQNFLSKLTNRPVDCYINDVQSINVLCRKFDDHILQNGPINNNLSTSRIIGNTWSIMPDNPQSNQSDNQYSFDSRPQRNIKIKN